jgi:hypothetical protein
MKPLGFSKTLKGAITGEYNQPGSLDYSISFDDETDMLKAVGFDSIVDFNERNAVRSELVKQGFDPNSPTLGMSISDIIGKEQKTAIEEAKAGRSPIPVEDAQGIAASKIQEDMRAREAAREQAQKAREQREADEREAQRQEAAKAAEYAKQETARQQREAAQRAREQREADEREAQRQEAARAAENARQEAARQQREADRLEAAREEAQRQRDQDEREDSGGGGWGDNDRDDSGWGGGSGGGWGFAQGGYVARKNTPKKVLIKR